MYGSFERKQKSLPYIAFVSAILPTPNHICSLLMVY